MNAAIRAVVRTALANNMNVIGVMHGYEGLVNGEFKPMGARDVGGILAARRDGFADQPQQALHGTGRSA
jgi:6-phosphofructokinase